MAAQTEIDAEPKRYNDAKPKLPTNWAAAHLGLLELTFGVAKNRAVRIGGLGLWVWGKITHDLPRSR